MNMAGAHKQTFIHSCAQLYRFTQVLNSVRERRVRDQGFLRHLAARIQSNVSSEKALLVLNSGEAKGTQRSAEQRETPNYRKSRSNRLEMRTAEWRSKISP